MSQLPPPYTEDLPLYSDVFADVPPAWSLELPVSPVATACFSPFDKKRIDSDIDPVVDFTSVHNVRTHVSKKKKQEQKKAQAAKWDDSDNEGEKPAGDDDHNGDGAGGGGSGGGAGGSGDGGNNGGGDDDDWNDGGGKKKKKGKKGKNKDDDEDEEEKEKAKENEAEKEEEAASPAAKVPGSFWDDNNGDVNPDDEWGVSSGKKKKGKKGKVCDVSSLSVDFI